MQFIKNSKTDPKTFEQERICTKKNVFIIRGEFKRFKEEIATLSCTIFTVFTCIIGISTMEKKILKAVSDHNSMIQRDFARIVQKYIKTEQIIIFQY